MWAGQLSQYSDWLRLDGPGIESRWGVRFSAPVQTGHGVQPAYCTMGTGSFPGIKSGRGVTLTPHLLPVPWSRKSIAIPLLPLWAVRSVQSLSASTRVHFTLPFSKMCANRTHETQSMHKTVSQIPNSTSIDKTSNGHKAQHTHKIKYTYNKTGNERITQH